MFVTISQRNKGMSKKNVMGTTTFVTMTEASEKNNGIGSLESRSCVIQEEWMVELRDGNEKQWSPFFLSFYWMYTRIRPMK